MPESIIVVGSCMIDFVCYTPRLPREGETVHGTKFVTNFGGKGANQCVAAAKLGGRTKMIARVGDDIWGDRYIQNFKAVGVDCKHVYKTPGYANGIAQIMVSDAGSNQIVIVAGANLQLNVADIQDARKDIENASVVVCQLETPVSVAIESAKITKGIFILNGAPGLTEFDDQLLTFPDIFCVNETEAEMFSGLSISTIDDAKAAIKCLLSKGCKCVIITLGEQGAVFADQESVEPEHVNAIKVKSIDTTGAGDCFIGALAYLLAYHKHLLLKDIVRAACFIASISCRNLGTQTSFPDSSVLQMYFSEVHTRKKMKE